MFFPYNTDAPIYYLPIITVCMIVLNVVVFVCSAGSSESELVLCFALEVGNGLHPYQWLTNNFLHGDFMHLLGNMFSFWAFGLVVEGKLGWLKTLSVYLGIGIIYGAFVQIIMLGGDFGYCLGASAIIFGMMAMCLVWAPENSMECLLLLRFRPFFFEVRIRTLVALSLFLQIFMLILMGGRLSSEFLHIVGAFVGFVVGIWLLKSGQVNCENWDIFSIWAGRNRMTDLELIKHEAGQAKTKKRRAEQISKQKKLLLEEIHLAIQNETPFPAFIIMQRMKLKFPNDKIPESDLLQLIRLLIEKQFWLESIEAMNVYLCCYGERSLVVRLNLARVLIRTNKPRAAKRVLTQIDRQLLDDSQTQIFHSLIDYADKTAAAMDQQGIYELAEYTESGMGGRLRYIHCSKHQ
jgi:membrane associated rhomboid family serine protease